MLPSQFIESLKIENLKPILEQYLNRLRLYTSPDDAPLAPEINQALAAGTYDVSNALNAARKDPVVDQVLKSVGLMDAFSPKKLLQMTNIQGYKSVSQVRANTQVYSLMVSQQAALETLLGLHNAAQKLLSSPEPLIDDSESLADFVIVDFDDKGIAINRINAITAATEALSKYVSKVFDIPFVEPRIVFAESGSDWRVRIKLSTDVAKFIMTCLTFYYTVLKTQPTTPVNVDLRMTLSQSAVQEALQGAANQDTALRLRTKIAKSFDTIVSYGVAPYEDDYQVTRGALVRHKPMLLAEPPVQQEEEDLDEPDASNGEPDATNIDANDMSE